MNEYYYFDRHKNKQPAFFRIMTILPSFRKMMKIVHIKFVTTMININQHESKAINPEPLNLEPFLAFYESLVRAGWKTDFSGYGQM